MGLLNVATGSPENNDVVEAGSLRFTTAAGYAAAVTAILAAATPVVDWIGGLDMSEGLKIAFVCLIGVGILGWAIASTGDVLARSYASAYIQPRKGDQEAKPLLGEFIAAYSKKDGPQEPAPSATTVLPAYPGMLVDAPGGNYHVLAIESKVGTASVRYLLASAGHAAKWVDNENITFIRVAEPPPATSSASTTSGG